MCVVALEIVVIAYHWVYGFDRNDGLTAGVQAVWFILTALLAYGVWRRSRASWTALLVVSAWPLFGLVTLFPSIREDWAYFALPMAMAGVQVALLLIPDVRSLAWGSGQGRTAQDAPGPR